MNNPGHTDDVGAPDPEMNTSPIADEVDEDMETLRQQVPGEPVCFFNNKSYPTGTFVKSGSSLLQCDYGIWIPGGPADPENP